MDESKRKFHDTDAVYVLPGDLTEHDRLNKQSDGINKMMHGQVIHSPVNHPERLLDVGCGTGVITRYMATQFPDAKEVFGLDLSPVPDQPSTRATFIQGEAMTATDPRLSQESFDLIFSRMLIMGITDWPAYILRAKSLLRSGGWLEMQEIQIPVIYNGDEEVISDSWDWLQAQREGFAEKGIDLMCVSKLEQYMIDAGFEDVHTKVFRWMMGPWKGHPETDAIADMHVKYNADMNFFAIKRFIGHKYTPEQLEDFRVDIMKRFGIPEEGKHARFYVVYGRKP